MSVGKVTFRGVEAPQPQPQTPEQTKVSFQGQEIDEEKSNAAKYMIGAAALAGVVALGIAGYKGHLGEGIQKFLGGAKKVTEPKTQNLEQIADKVTNNISKEKILSVQTVKDERSGVDITRTLFEDGSRIDHFPAIGYQNSYSLKIGKDNKVIEMIRYKVDGMTVLEKISGEEYYRILNAK